MLQLIAATSVFTGHSHIFREKDDYCAVLCLVAQACLMLCDPMDCSLPASSVEFSRQEYWSGLHALPQGIFPTQGSNPVLLHCGQILYLLSHQGSPRILDCVAYPSSRGTSWPRNWTRVSCIAGRFFMSWAARGALCTTDWLFFWRPLGFYRPVYLFSVPSPTPVPHSQQISLLRLWGNRVSISICYCQPWMFLSHASCPSWP